MDNPCAPDQDFKDTKVLDPNDAAQAFVEGIIEAIDKRLISCEEAHALACGRIQTVIMENVAELTLMADDPNASEVTKLNTALIAEVYRINASEMKRVIQFIMTKGLLIARGR
jgi:hypothetical protein